MARIQNLADASLLGYVPPIDFLCLSYCNTEVWYSRLYGQQSHQNLQNPAPARKQELDPGSVEVWCCLASAEESEIVLATCLNVIPWELWIPRVETLELDDLMLELLAEAGNA